jgi:hypothetical protein
MLAFPAWKTSGAAAETEISESARGEIAALLAEKETWTPAQQKMDSELIHAAKLDRGEAFAPGVRQLRLDVTREADGRVLADIHAKVTPELLGLIERGGGKVVGSYPEFQSVRALLVLNQLETLAALPEVMSICRASRAQHNTGSVDSEGDTTESAALARTTYGVDGTGVKIGVLSDSVDSLSDAQATGDLGTVTVLPGQSGVPATGEGTAMLEIIHDLAPGAQLYFATADGSEAAFAQNIVTLRNAYGCDILVDDSYYFDESPFQDATIAQAVNTVTAGGALYFSSAGNSGNLDSGTSGTWEGDFADGGSVSFPEKGHIHSFGPATYNTVSTGSGSLRADLFWSDPLNGSGNDYDLFLLNAAGTAVVASSMTRQSGSQNPYESISSVTNGERLVIVKYSGSARFLHLGSGRGQLAIATTGAIFGHNGATNAFSTAAVDEANAYPGAFTGGAADPVETFSSDGPRRVFYNADGSAITPGNLSSTGGAVRQKPDVAATDGVSTSLSSFTPFYGTSAAAPHAAAIAGLLKSYNSGLNASQIRTLLTGTALDIMRPGVDWDSGYGIVMATSALAAAPPDSLFITPGSGVSVTGSAGGPFAVAGLGLTLTNNGTSPLNWSLANTSAWFTVSAAGGTLSPGGTAATVSVTPTAAVNGLPAGSYAATLWITNTTSSTAQTRAVTLTVTPFFHGAYANYVRSLSPIGFWRLNETNQPPPADIVTNSGSLGVAADGLGSDGVIQGEPGVVQTCFRFSNPTLSVPYFGSHVDVPYLAAFNPNGPFTVELWAMPAQATSDLYSPASSVDINQNSGASRNGWVIYQETSMGWEFRMGGLNGYAVTLNGGSSQENVWHHVVGVYDGTHATLYVDGQLVSGPTLVSGFNPNTEMPLRFGATTIPNRTFDGWVDEVAFYNTALSAQTVAAHYAAATTNNAGYDAQILASRPLGYWNLDGPVYTAPSPSTLPVAVNLGILAPAGNGIYEPGALPGSAGLTAPGLGIGNLACGFNGPGYVDVPAVFFNLTGPLSVLAWVKLQPANGSTEAVVSKGAASYRLLVDGNGFPHFACGSQTGGDLIGSNRIDDQQWHQLLGVYDGLKTESFFVDTRLVASSLSASNPVVGNTEDLWIGGDPDTGTAQWFNGEINEVAVFTNALTLAKSQQMLFFATNLPPVPSIARGTSLSNGSVPLNWSAATGQTYQVQYATNLVRPVWNNLGSPTQANSATIGVTDTTPTDQQRFYRVVLLE